MGDGQAAPKASGIARELKALMKERLVQMRDVAPLQHVGFIRVSSFASLCPREEVLVGLENLVRKDTVSADLSTIFTHGTALHWAMQNILLPEINVLRGQWRCNNCSTRVGALEPGRQPVDCAVSRPNWCGVCGSEQGWTFEEYTLVNEEYRVQGHNDGFLEIEGMPGLGVFEGKSINPKGAWEVRETPKLDHVIQTQMYMWLTDTLWGKIFYWDKSGQGMGAFIEHTIERDEETIEEIKLTVKAIWDGIEGRAGLPDRICENPGCKRAEACAVSTICFERT